MSRRRFLALSATVVVASCSGDDPPTTTPLTESRSPDPSSPNSESSTSTPSTSTTSTLPTDAGDRTMPDADPTIELPVDPFTFGVASGDPEVGSVVIWTRLSGDLPPEGIEVTWTYTPDDPARPRIEGVTGTNEGWGGSVHVIVNTTVSGTYQFRAGGWDSPIGATAPIDPEVDEFRIAAACCQNYETGWYSAHRDIAEWRPDLVAFLGDFIYETAATTTGVRSHEGPEATDLEGYRRRYATYLSDPDLQNLRAVTPWLAIWDDHEVAGDYAGRVQDGDDIGTTTFAVRRAEAYRAWWEHMPTRLPPPPSDPDDTWRIRRGIDVGDLLQISAVDGRQFRSDQLSDDVFQIGPPAEGWDDPDRTMLGGTQEVWIEERFRRSTARWNCLVQQTVLADMRVPSTGGILDYDQWDGYSPARDLLLAAAPDNLVTLSGDVHYAAVCLLGDPERPSGVEFVTTALSSPPTVDPFLAPAFDGFESVVDIELERRGYVRHTVTADRWIAEYRQVVDETDPESDVVTWNAYIVESGSTEITTVAPF